MCNHKECDLSTNNRTIAECKYCNKGQTVLREVKGDVESFCSNDKCLFYVKIYNVINGIGDNRLDKLSKCSKCNYG